MTKQIRSTGTAKQPTVGRFEIDPTELQARKDNAKGFYVGSFEESQRPGRGAIVQIAIQGTAIAAERYHELRSEGYSPLPHGSPLNAFDVQHGMVTLYMIKPEAVQDTELSAIYSEVENAYRAELQAARTSEVERVAQQQYQLAQRKRLEAQQAEEAAELERLRLEVSAALSGGQQ